MIYSDIKSKVYLLTKTDSDSLPDATMVILANNAYERVTSLILQADSRWQFDDLNNTDLPIATTALAANQQDYSLAVDFLVITRLECLDQNGNWVLLLPFDQKDLYSQAMTEFLKAPGLPKFYDKLGNSVFLYPTPNYSQAASLKFYFKRGPSYFVSGDTTKKPGFNALYHDLIPLWISYDYAVANGLKNTNQIFSAIQAKELALQEDYNLRDKDETPMLIARQPSAGWNWFR